MIGVFVFRRYGRATCVRTFPARSLRETFKVGYAGSLILNLGSTPRWVWVAVAVMAIAAAEYLMSPQIPH